MLLDCANGATYQAAPEIFRRLGAHVTCWPTSPTGATSTTAAARRTSELLSGRRSRGGKFDVGFAFDGDGDRVLAVDRTGAVVDGDELIALAALHLRERGLLQGGGVAVTVMTNYGFHTAMRRGRHRDRQHRRRRPLRARRAPPPGLVAGRRAVRAHHQPRLRAVGRRDRERAADAAGARRSRPGASATRCASCRSGSSTSVPPTAAP